VRVWPVVAITVALVAALAWIWTSFGVQRQSRVLATLAATGSASILAWIWLVLFSRLRRSLRLTFALVTVALCLVAAATLERRGLSGDALPLFAFRWSAPGPGEAVPERAAGLSNLRARPDEASDAWPQFLGPRRDGTLAELSFATDWERQTPRQLWRRPVGRGWSGFAVAGPFAVTQEQRDDAELVTCYDRDSGALIWVHRDPVRHDDPLGGPGPRATPTIHDGTVFTLGATGILNALELETGRLVWAVDVMGDNGVVAPTYGVAASPLVIGDVVVVPGGGPPAGHSLVAYEVASGRKIWAGGDDPAAYGSPVLARLAGREQIVWLTERSLVGQDPTDGTVLWSHPWPAGTEKVSQPVILSPDRVFASTGYGIGAKLFRIVDGPAGLTTELLWESTGLKAKLSNVVSHGGYLYGLDDGILVCLDPGDGSRRFKGGRYGHGQMILVGSVLLIQSESGDVVLVEATPEAHREIARLPALSNKTWNHPALAGRHLLVRNDREAACYELPRKGPPVQGGEDG